MLKTSKLEFHEKWKKKKKKLQKIHKQKKKNKKQSQQNTKDGHQITTAENRRGREEKSSTKTN